MGGVVATGTAGPRRFRYGAPRDLLIGITVVRADGVVAHSGGKVVKNVAGYDLGKLFSGSQGTLGLITEATFRLHPRPAAVAWVTGGVRAFGPGWRGRGGGVGGGLGAGARRPWSWTGRADRSGRCGSGCWSRARPPGWPNGPSSCPSCWLPRAESAAVADVPPARWGQLPSSSTVVRVSFWVSSLGVVLDALAAAGDDAGVRPAVSGPAGAGALYACLDPEASHDAAARFVTALRERIGSAQFPGGPGQRGRAGRAGAGARGGRCAWGPCRAPP